MDSRLSLYSASSKERVAVFIADSSDEEDEVPNFVEEIQTLELTVSEEVEFFKVCKGCLLTSKEHGGYLCPLQWWKMHYKKYPSVWSLAIHILCIPASSALAESIFSAAVNVVNKKQICLDLNSADLLIFLCGNSNFVEWGVLA
jgi:hypothetical protein